MTVSASVCPPLAAWQGLSEHSCAMTHTWNTLGVRQPALWRGTEARLVCDCVEGRQRTCNAQSAGCADIVSGLNGKRRSDDTDDGDPRHGVGQSHAVSSRATGRARHEGAADAPSRAGLCPPLAGLPPPPSLPSHPSHPLLACRELSSAALFTATTSHSARSIIRGRSHGRHTAKS